MVTRATKLKEKKILQKTILEIQALEQQPVATKVNQREIGDAQMNVRETK